MKKLLILFIFISTITYGQKTGDRAANVTARDTLETESQFMYRDTVVPVLDISYHEFSVDSTVWTKDDTNANWVRFSNDVKNTWWVLPYAVFTELWEVSNDTLRPKNPVYVVLDSLRAINFIDAPLYQKNGDSLKITDLNASDGTVGQILFTDGTNSYWDGIGSGFGEVNVGTNVNARGVGVYDAKVDTSLNFRGIASLTELLTVVLAVDSTIDLDLELKTIYAGIGLSGGGSMEGDVTLNVYIPELTEMSWAEHNPSQDYVIIYDGSGASHKKIKTENFFSDVYINKIKDASSVVALDFSGGNNVTITGDGAGSVSIAASQPDLYLDSVLAETSFEELNLIAGANITLTNLGNGNVLVESTGDASLPICDEGEFLAYIGGTWVCVNVCDYICADTIINIINDYNDTIPSRIEPSGDVVINFTRADCADSVSILATDFVKTTTNLTTIKIVTVPSVGELHYDGVTVINGQELSVTQGVLDAALYYVADESTGSQYIDPFVFQVLYSSNASYSNSFNVNVNASACVEDAICYGYLYNGYALDDPRELTSSADWQVAVYTSHWLPMLTYMSPTQSIANTKAKEEGALRWNSPSGTNDFGLSAIGGGVRNTDGTFAQFKDKGTYVSPKDATTLVRTVFISGIGSWSGANGDKAYGGAVRLVKDATGLSDGVTTTYTGNDGKTYNAIVINELYWTTENLEETQYRNGAPIPNVTDNTTWANLTTGALCLYDNDLNNACKTTPDTDNQFSCGSSINNNNTTALSYRDYNRIAYVDVGAAVGTIDFSFSTSTVPDMFLVYVGGELVLNTGFYGNVSQFGIGGTSRSTFNSLLEGTIDPVNGGTYPSSGIGIDIDGYPVVNDYNAITDTTVSKPNDAETAVVQVWSVPQLSTVFGCNLGCVEEIVSLGYLYNGFAAINPDITSGSGWEVPTMTDFQGLANYLGAGGDFANNTVGDSLKRTGTTYWAAPNANATNSYGFNAKGAAKRDSVGVFGTLGQDAGYWSRDTVGGRGKVAFLTSVSSSFDCSGTNTTNLKSGYSIRLTKSAIGIPDGTTTTYTGNDGKEYNAIAINERYWMTEDLEETRESFGDWEGEFNGYVFPMVKQQSTWADLEGRWEGVGEDWTDNPAYCLLDNDESYAANPVFREPVDVAISSTNQLFLAENAKGVAFWGYEDTVPTHGESGLSLAHTRLDPLGGFSSDYWILAGVDGRIYKSADGISWNDVSGAIFNKGYAVLLYNDTIYAVGDGANDFYYSADDGGTWNGANYFSTTPRSIRVENGLFVVGMGDELITGENSIAYSSDAQSWSEVKITGGVEYYVSDVIYADPNTGGQSPHWFVSGKGNTNGIMTSEDMVAWEAPLVTPLGSEVSQFGYMSFRYFAASKSGTTNWARANNSYFIYDFGEEWLDMYIDYPDSEPIIGDGMCIAVSNYHLYMGGGGANSGQILHQKVVPISAAVLGEIRGGISVSKITTIGSRYLAPPE